MMHTERMIMGVVVLAAGLFMLSIGILSRIAPGVRRRAVPFRRLLLMQAIGMVAVGTGTIVRSYAQSTPGPWRAVWIALGFGGAVLVIATGVLTVRAVALRSQHAPTPR